MATNKRKQDLKPSEQYDRDVPLSLEKKYPSFAKWVDSYGWIEIGQQDWNHNAMVYVLDEGGTVWEGKARYDSVDDLFRELENALEKWFEENG